MGRLCLSIVLLSLILSALAVPWVKLPWWNVLRRCVSIAAALSVVICARTFEHRTLRSYGFFDRKAGKTQFLLGILLGIGALTVIGTLGLASGAYHISIIADRLRLWRTVLTFVPIACLVGVLEELVFRGFILQHLLASSKSIAVIANSALYAVVHLKTKTLTWDTYFELIGLFLLGVVLSLSFLRTRQLYLAVGLHATLAYGARVNKLLIEFPHPSISWLFGTTRLINGLMSWITLLGVVGVVVWRTRRLHRGGVGDGRT